MHLLCPHCRNPIEVVKITPREEIACPSCGSSFRLDLGSTASAARHAGQKIGRFEIVEAVGSGAFGTVFKARDPDLDRTVALKVPRAGNLAGPQELDRFLREARSAAQLRHPSVVSVHEVGQADGLPFIVSDFVQGATLADLLSARRPGFRESAELIAAVADALQYAHDRGVVHRDVKPSNVIIGEDGRPLLMDFGLAKREAGEITMTVEGQVLGTPAYMSPEQARGEGHAVDGRGDVYSLGVVLYELLAGELPFRGTQRMLLMQVLQDEPRPPRRVNDKIPRDLETVCLKAMAKEPGRRYQAARELADDLRRFLDGRQVLARRAGPAARLYRWGRRNPVIAGLTAALLLLLVASTIGSALAAYHFSRLAGAEVKARGDADAAKGEIKKQADQLRDELDRLNQANTLMETGRWHAEAGRFDKALAAYTAAVEQRPDVSTTWLTRGHFYLQFHCWDDAAADFARGFALQPPGDPNLWVSHALLRHYVHDADGYRTACAAMFERFGQSEDKVTHDLVAKACTGGPDALDDGTRLLLRAQDTELGSDVSPGLFLSALVRAGKARPALLLWETDAQVRKDSHWSEAEIALAYHQVGNDDRAREHFPIPDQGLDGRLDSIEAFIEPNGQGLMGNDHLRDALLRREAYRVLGGQDGLEDAEDWALTAMGRVALGRRDEASAALARAVALRPANAHLRVLYGHLLFARGRPEEATAELDEAVRKNPKDDDLLFERARLYAARCQWGRATEDLNRWLEKPNDTVDDYDVAPTWVGDFNELLQDHPLPGYQDMLAMDELFDALIRLRPRDGALWHGRASVLDQKRREADAFAAFGKALEFRPDDLALLHDRASFCARHARWDQAAADCARLLEKPDGQGPDHSNLHDAIYSDLAREWDPAVLEKLRALRPADGRLCEAGGRCYARRREWDKALAAYAGALNLLPDDADLRKERAELFVKLGRWKEAAADYGLIPLDDRDFIVACLLVLAGDADGYRTLCAGVAKRYAKAELPADAEFAIGVLILSPDSGVNPALAVGLLEKTFKGLEPDITWDHVPAMAYNRAGRFDEAVRWSREMLQQQPEARAADEPLEWLCLALAYRGLKQPEEARKCLDKAAAWLKEANAGRLMEEAESMPVKMDMADWLEYQILHREAEALLNDKRGNPKR